MRDSLINLQRQRCRWWGISFCSALTGLWRWAPAPAHSSAQCSFDTWSLSQSFLSRTSQLEGRYCKFQTKKNDGFPRIFLTYRSNQWCCTSTKISSELRPQKIQASNQVGCNSFAHSYNRQCSWRPLCFICFKPGKFNDHLTSSAEAWGSFDKRQRQGHRARATLSTVSKPPAKSSLSIQRWILKKNREKIQTWRISEWMSMAWKWLLTDCKKQSFPPKTHRMIWGFCYSISLIDFMQISHSSETKHRFNPIFSIHSHNFLFPCRLLATFQNWPRPLDSSRRNQPFFLFPTSIFDIPPSIHFSFYHVRYLYHLLQFLFCALCSFIASLLWKFEFPSLFSRFREFFTHRTFPIPNVSACLIWSFHLGISYRLVGWTAAQPSEDLRSATTQRGDERTGREETSSEQHKTEGDEENGRAAEFPASQTTTCRWGRQSKITKACFFTIINCKCKAGKI